MATSPPKFKFPGRVGTKRRRMRSGGNVSAITDNTPMAPPVHLDDMGGEEEVVTLAEADDVGEKVVQTSKCKGVTTIPIFLKKTYKMVDTCDPSIASWTAEGDMFVVKDPDIFATRVIPQYFDHNKFSSFARQLNFYGFRKMQSKPIRNSDFDASAAKHVTFFNENFKRGRCDLLKKIQRSTRGSGASTGQDHAREIQTLRDQVSNLEAKIQDMTVSTEERFRRLELDMLARIEQVMMAMQQQQAQLRLHAATSTGTVNSSANSNNMGSSSSNSVSNGGQHVNSNAPRSFSVSAGPPPVAAPQPSIEFAMQPQSIQATSGSSMTVGVPLAPVAAAGGPTLPPHPKQKQLPLGGLPGAMGAPAGRLNSLRGISALSRGISGIPRGASVESSSSAVLLRNSWEDKFFSMLMLDENGQNTGAAAVGGVANNNNNENLVAPAQPPHPGAAVGAGVGQSVPAMVSERSEDSNSGGQQKNKESMPSEDLSSVSSSDIP